MLEVSSVLPCASFTKRKRYSLEWKTTPAFNSSTNSSIRNYSNTFLSSTNIIMKKHRKQSRLSLVLSLLMGRLTSIIGLVWIKALFKKQSFSILWLINPTQAAPSDTRYTTALRSAASVKYIWLAVYKMVSSMLSNSWENTTQIVRSASSIRINSKQWKTKWQCAINWTILFL